jgi:hypothetical protein
MIYIYIYIIIIIIIMFFCRMETGTAIGFGLFAVLIICCAICVSGILKHPQKCCSLFLWCTRRNRQTRPRQEQQETQEQKPQEQQETQGQKPSDTVEEVQNGNQLPTSQNCCIRVWKFVRNCCITPPPQPEQQEDLEEGQNNPEQRVTQGETNTETRLNRLANFFRPLINIPTQHRPQPHVESENEHIEIHELDASDRTFVKSVVNPSALFVNRGTNTSTETSFTSSDTAIDIENARPPPIIKPRKITQMMDKFSDDYGNIGGLNRHGLAYEQVIYQSVDHLNRAEPVIHHEKPADNTRSKAT